MALSYAFGVFVLILVLLRQVRIRPVRRVFRATLPIVLGVIGIFQMSAYAGDHHIAATAWAWVLGSLLIGAVGLGVLRGLTMRVWSSNQWVVRQGTALTMGLWLVTLLAHFAVDGATGTRGLESSSFLLYLGLTIGAQAYVVYRRAQPLWNELGPNAGRPLQVHFGDGPGAVFTFFSTGGAPPNQWDPGGRHDDHDVIDVDVVEDDDHDNDNHGPPELHAPR
jgi:hypothetical protein